MPTYMLTITIDAAGLDALSQAGQQVAIAMNSETTVPVIWLAFRPLESNTINWNEEYQVYATNGSPAPGEIIVVGSAQPAVAGWVYTFSDGHFDTGRPGNNPTAYAVANNDSDFSALTMGLLHQASGSIGTQLSPLNAVVTYPQMNAVLEPIATISVFTYAGANNGMVISSIPEDALQLDFTQTSSQTIMYDDAKGQFVQVG